MSDIEDGDAMKSCVQRDTKQLLLSFSVIALGVAAIFIILLPFLIRYLPFRMSHLEEVYGDYLFGLFGCISVVVYNMHLAIKVALGKTLGGLKTGNVLVISVVIFIAGVILSFITILPIVFISLIAFSLFTGWLALLFIALTSSSVFGGILLIIIFLIYKPLRSLRPSATKICSHCKVRNWDYVPQCINCSMPFLPPSFREKIVLLEMLMVIGLIILVAISWQFRFIKLL